MTQDAVYTKVGCLWAKIMMSSVSKNDLFQVSTIIITGEKNPVVARQCPERRVVTARAVDALSSGTRACIKTPCSPNTDPTQFLSAQHSFKSC